MKFRESPGQPFAETPKIPSKLFMAFCTYWGNIRVILGLSDNPFKTI